MVPELRASLGGTGAFSGVGHSFLSSEAETVFTIGLSRLDEVLSSKGMPPLRGFRHYTKLLLAMTTEPASGGPRHLGALLHVDSEYIGRKQL